MPKLSNFSFRRLNPVEAKVSYKPPSLDLLQDELEYAIRKYEERSSSSGSGNDYFNDFVNLRNMVSRPTEPETRRKPAIPENRGGELPGLDRGPEIDLSSGVLLDADKLGLEAGSNILELEDTLSEAKNTLKKYRKSIQEFEQ